MSQIYELVSFGTSPVSLDKMKTFLKITNDSEDDLIKALIDSATQWGEKYTGREFRANKWNRRDSFLGFELLGAGDEFVHAAVALRDR